MAIIQHIQHAVQTPAISTPTTGASLLTMAAAFLDKIHGPMATIGVILGAIWVGLQIYLAVEKRWFGKKKGK
jgi:type IV secretory pathway VirB2 component (pilin)